MRPIERKTSASSSKQLFSVTGSGLGAAIVEAGAMVDGGVSVPPVLVAGEEVVLEAKEVKYGKQLNAVMRELASTQSSAPHRQRKSR